MWNDIKIPPTKEKFLLDLLFKTEPKCKGTYGILF